MTITKWDYYMNVHMFLHTSSYLLFFDTTHPPFLLPETPPSGRMESKIQKLSNEKKTWNMSLMKNISSLFDPILLGRTVEDRYVIAVQE